MKGYQFLQNDFFQICRKRRITKLPMLLLIYLRGLYSRFGNIFTWRDQIIIKDLGIDRRTLQRARLTLQERGVIDFISGIGPEPTQYLILDSILAPERVVKNAQGVVKNVRESGQIAHSLYNSKERLKKRVGYGNRRRLGTTAQELLKKYASEP